MSLEQILDGITADPLLWSDFNALCDTGGRQAGSDSAASAFTFAAIRMAAIGTVCNEPSSYAGWTCHAARVVHEPSGRLIHAVPLLGTMACEDLVLETRDMGRGAPGQFGPAGGMAGLAAMVRHEYPFSTHAVHRRVKVAAAAEAGAEAIFMVQPEPGVGPVSGSSGRNGGAGIPGLGIGVEDAALLASGGRVRITIAAEDHPAETPNLVMELPGRSSGMVVLSAHLDGHALGESALDNATGVAAALCLARAMAPHVAGCENGLMLCLFGAEEWALAGSRAWLAAQPAERLARMRMNLNLDSVAGHGQLTALTSGFAELPEFLRGAWPTLAVHEPLMPNSDHANFAALGVPAARIIAGFNAPQSNLRFLLTAADRRQLTSDGELRAATLAAARMLWAALTLSR